MSLALVLKGFSQKEYKYCELAGYSKFLSEKMVVVIDYGDGVNFETVSESSSAAAPPPVETKNEKQYVETKESMYEGKSVQTDNKGKFIWKKVEVVKAAPASSKPKAKVTSFASMIEAMDYMDKMGWEFVQAYVVSSGSQSVNHWILRKK